MRFWFILWRIWHTIDHEIRFKLLRPNRTCSNFLYHTCWTEGKEKTAKVTASQITIANVEMNPEMNDDVECFLEILSHEHMHDILAKRVDMDSRDMLDNIDLRGEITPA